MARRAPGHERRSTVLSECQVDESLDRVHRGDDYAQLRAGAQPAAAAAAAPAMTVLLHHVQVIAQVIDMQQAVNRDLQDLHEAAELHHGGDEALEALPDALL